MVERVAVALYENAYPPDIRSGYEWDMVPGYWHEQARAAIAAIYQDHLIVSAKGLDDAISSLRTAKRMVDFNSGE